MKCSRREFFSGASAFVLGVGRPFAAPPGWKPSKKPNLVLDRLFTFAYKKAGFPGKRGDGATVNESSGRLSARGYFHSPDGHIPRSRQP